jgi:uncharacterized membrane protein YbaN (DUF454 family)
MSDQQRTCDRPLWLRIIYAIAGIILIILGIISGFIPIIPGFVLVIIGLALLTRVSPRIGFWMRGQLQKIIGTIKGLRKK